VLVLVGGWATDVHGRGTGVIGDEWWWCSCSCSWGGWAIDVNSRGGGAVSSLGVVMALAIMLVGG